MSLILNGFIRFEDYVIDPHRWTIQWRDEPLVLNRKSFDLLLFLISHRDQVTSKQQLLESLWPGQYVEESNLTQQIFLLRKALSRHESGAKIIETIPGRGYRFTSVVETEQPVEPRPADGPDLFQQQIVVNRSSITQITIEEEEIEGDEGERAALSGASRFSTVWRSHRALIVVVGILGLAALSGGGWFGWELWLNRAGGPPVEVVLTPFDGTTGDPVLDRALVDALRMDLAQSPFVSVVSSSKIRATLAQMVRKPDDPLNPATAREICERINSQAVLQGTIARLGQHYLVTEEAVSCVNGGVLAASKEEANSADDLPRSLDKLAASLRQKLGESRSSIARFEAPLFSQNTSSLEALKDFSQAIHNYEQGNLPQAIAMDKRAIAADPDFAGAYLNLAAYNYSAGDQAEGKAAVLKAYSLRDQANEPLRLAISVYYNITTTQNVFETERLCRNWTQLYPRSLNAWNTLSNAQRDLGDLTEAVYSARRNLSLWPDNQGNINNVATLQMSTGDTAGSRATLDQALAQKMDGQFLRENYLLLGWLLHDQPLVETQRAWAASHPDAGWVFVADSGIAVGQGRFVDARKLIDQAARAFRQQGLPAVAERVSNELGVDLIEAGDLAEGKKQLHGFPVDSEDMPQVVGLTDSGEFAAATAGLHTMQTRYPQGTLINLYWAPRVQAGIALANHKPNDAVALMEPTRRFDHRDFLSYPKFRADCYLAAGQPKNAEQEYRAIIAHPEFDPVSSAIPLSWLGLGRALAAQGNKPAAVDAYQHFLTLWAQADPDALYLRQGRQELSTLTARDTASGPTAP